MNASVNSDVQTRQLGLGKQITNHKQTNNGSTASSNQLGLGKQASGTQLGLRNPKVLIGLLIVLLTVGIGGIIWFSNTNATGALSQVNFPKVSIFEGSKFYLNGTKSLTAIKDGKLFADNTNGTAVEGSQINSELTSFANSQYGNDAGKNYLTNPNLLSEQEVRNSLGFIPKTNNDYWLKDAKKMYGIQVRGHKKYNNYDRNISYKLSGKLSTGEMFAGNTVSFGNFDVAATTNFENINKSQNSYIWSLTTTDITKFRNYYTSFTENMWDGLDVFNNPMLKDSPSDGYYKTKAVMERGVRGFQVAGKVIKSGDVCFLKQITFGDTVNVGDTLFVVHGDIVDDEGFGRDISGRCIYFKVNENGFVVRRSNLTSGMRGVYSESKDATGYEGMTLNPARYAIRPVYTYDINKIAYLKNNISETTVIDSTLGNLPDTNATYYQSYKAVVKSSNITISDSILGDKLTTDRTSGSGNRPTVKYENDTIKVPYGSTKLTLSNCFNTKNTTHISALAENSGDKKYGVLAQSTSSDVTLDLTNLLVNTQVGSNCTISFYAEKVNGANTSDEISDKAVTVKLEVVEGAEQTITYANGGGTGTVPAVAKIKAGSNYNLANGSELTKDGNPFSCWQLDYVNSNNEEETRLVKSGESIIIPDTFDGNITATAIFGGFAAKKITDTRSTVSTITWNANLPDGISVTSWTGASSLSEDMTKYFQKVKLKGLTVALPVAPSIDSLNWVFDGWYDSPTGGNKLIGQTPVVNTNVTYYAHWQNGFIVTFDLNPPNEEVARWGDITSPNTLTSLAKPSNFIIENPSGVTASPKCVSDACYSFIGWFDSAVDGNQITIGTSSVSANKTIYAHWTKDVFLAKVDGTNFDPTNLSTYANADITSIADVKAAATTIANGGTNPNTTKYNATNDQYHLFARIGGTATSTTANDWLECRIIHVGQHDNDGSGLTFQAVHNTGSRIVYSSKSDGNWSTSSVRSDLNRSLYKLLPDILKINIREISKKSNSSAGKSPNGGSTDISQDKLWIMSYTEFVKNSTSSSYWNDASHDGSVYEFWSSKNLRIDSTPSSSSVQRNLFYKLNCNRAGTLIVDPDGGTEGYSWLRSLSTSKSYAALYFDSDGIISSYNGIIFSIRCCVVPCFAM